MRRPSPVSWVCVLIVSLANAAEESPQERFQSAVVALKQGDANGAIGELELLADRGFVHPDASFNRAAAYILRADSAQAERGDLGRAAAALEEVLLLRPDDATAAYTLERIREEIARHRAKRGAGPVVQRASLGRAMLGLFSEDSWAIGALVGSAVLSVGLAIWLWARQRAAAVAGPVMAAVGTILLLGAGLLTWASRSIRLEERPAVVVAAEARLADERGIALSAGEAGGQTIVPEGASVRVLEIRGTTAQIAWGESRGWVMRNQLRILARP